MSLKINIDKRNLSEAIFEDAYQRYHRKLYFYFVKKTCSDYLSEELVQLTFIKLWKDFDKTSEDIPISSRIFCIARTTLIDALRKEAKEREVLSNIQKEKKNSFSQNTVFEICINEDINHAINTLPPIRKKIFQLRRLKGLSHKEIAQKCAISVKTVEDHITKATKHLKTLLKYGLAIGLAILFSAF